MTALNIEFASSLPDGIGGATLAVFVDRALSLPATANRNLRLEPGQIARAAADAGFRGNAGEALTILSGDAEAGLRVVLVGTVPRAGDRPLLPIELGGYAARAAAYARRTVVAAELPGSERLTPQDAAELALGFRLRGYRFDAYRTRSGEPPLPADRTLSVLIRDAAAAATAFAAEAGLAEGVELARDLVNEPANVLTPSAFAERIASLRDLGLKIDILNSADLERLGFRALLAVGQGSAEESHAAILRWNGADDPQAAPVAAIGKGVCFDAGGISIKPALGLADMKGDMAGAAAVVGFMRALARRGARINAVGAVGLVENMPDGRAQRPGDIVRSLSGQTIEVVDTDYEGRMVLADLLWHAQAVYRPRFMVDLATLTDAVAAGIGREYAGLFANDDALATSLIAAGGATGEIVWRLPLGPGFDRQIDSRVADVRNIDAKAGGGCTAANFLRRFVNDCPWAHLDIAGPAQDMPETAINTSWGTGWGVRLLDNWARRLEDA